LNLAFIAGKPHVDSFNFMLGEGLRLAAADIKPLQFEIPETKARLVNMEK
jgi:hypothetical protein